MMSMAKKTKAARQNERSPVISIRMRSTEGKEALIAKAKAVGKSINQHVLDLLSGDGSSMGNTTRLLQLAKDLEYLFAFFQKNASNLDIDDQERAEIKAIYARLNEP